MNAFKTYDELNNRLEALADEIPEKKAAKEAAAAKKAEAYNTAFWETMHTGMVQNTLKEGSDGSGGYLVPDTFDENLTEQLAQENVLRKISQVFKTSRRLRIPVAEDMDCAAWVPEGTPIPFLDVEIGEIVIDAYKLATSIKVSDELLEDSGIDLEDYIQKIFTEQIGKKEEEGFLKGTGSGMPLGLIYQTPVGAVSEKAGDISIDDMIDLMHSLEEPYRKNALWLISEDAYLKLRKITNHNGVPLWNTQLEKDDLLTLLGHPILVSAYLDSVVPGSKPVLFGDFSYYWIGERGKRVIKRLVECYANQGQVAFLTSERVDAKLVLPEAIKCLEVKAA